MPANNSIEILTSISKSVSMIVSYLAPQNTDKDSVSKLSRGVSSTPPPSAAGDTIKMESSSISALVTSLSGLPSSVKKVAGLSGKTVKNFKSVMVDVSSAVKEVSKTSKSINFKAIDELKKGVGSVEDIIKLTAKMSVISPLSLVGVAGISVTMPLLMSVLINTSKHKIDENVISNLNNANVAIKPITSLAKDAILLTVACAGLGAAVAKGGGKDVILAGLGTLGVTLVTMTALVGTVGLASRMLKDVGALDGIKSITLLTLTSIGLVAACAGLGAIISKGDTSKIIMNGLTVLGGTLLTLTAIIGITGIASRAIKGTGAIAGFKDIIILTVASMGIVAASKFLGDFVNENGKSILIGLSSTLGIIGGIMGIAFLASKLSTTVSKGVLALAAIEGIAFGAMGIVFAASKLSDEIKGKGKDIAITLASVGGVLTAFGGLAAAASFISPYIAVGSAALGASELMALGAIGLVKKIIDLDLLKNEVGVGWKAIAKDVAGVGGVVSAFGLIASAFSLLTIPITLALPATALTVSFAKKSIDVIREVLEISKSIDEFGGIEKLTNTVKKDVPSLMSGFTVKNFAIPMTLIEMGKLKASYAAMASVTKSLMSSVELISKIANIGELTSDGKIKPVIYINPKTGEIKYGAAVDIKKVASIVCDTFNIFVGTMNRGIKGLGNMITGAAMFKILGNVVTPITKFVDMISGFVGGTTSDGGDYELTPVRIDENGKITYGAKVPVRGTALSIVNAISTFVDEIYGEKNAALWASYVYGDRNAFQKLFGSTNTKSKSINKIGGMLGTLVSPVADFVELISNFESSGDGKLVKVIVNSDGTITRGGEIDVKSVSKSIGDVITSFVSSVYGGENIKLSNDKKKTLETVLNDGGSLIGLIGDLTDEKLNLKRLDDVYANIRKGTDAILGVSSSLRDMDAVLNEEKERRKKNINELGESIEKLLEKFKGVDNSVNTLYNLIVALQSMDPEKISTVISSLKGGDSFLKNGGVEKLAQGESKNTPAQIHRVGVNKEDITDAIITALEGLRVSGGGTSEEDTGDVAMNALIGVFKNMQFELQK